MGEFIYHRSEILTNRKMEPDDVVRTSKCLMLQTVGLLAVFFLAAKGPSSSWKQRGLGSCSGLELSTWETINFYIFRHISKQNLWLLHGPRWSAGRNR